MASDAEGRVLLRLFESQNTKLKHENASAFAAVYIGRHENDRDERARAADALLRTFGKNWGTYNKLYDFIWVEVVNGAILAPNEKVRASCAAWFYDIARPGIDDAVRAALAKIMDSVNIGGGNRYGESVLARIKALIAGAPQFSSRILLEQFAHAYVRRASANQIVELFSS